jgi:hypothetical protein
VPRWHAGLVNNLACYWCDLCHASLRHLALGSEVLQKITQLLFGQGDPWPKGDPSRYFCGAPHHLGVCLFSCISTPVTGRVLGVIFAYHILVFVSPPSWTTFAISLLYASPFFSHGVVPLCDPWESSSWLGEEGVPPSKDVLGWRLEAEGEVPRPRDNEVIVLSSFYEHRFGLPLHPFVCGLLHNYQVEIQNLHPNAILHIECFIMLCEAFMGIDPTGSCGSISSVHGCPWATTINCSSGGPSFHFTSVRRQSTSRFRSPPPFGIKASGSTWGTWLWALRCSPTVSRCPSWMATWWGGKPQNRGREPADGG